MSRTPPRPEAGPPRPYAFPRTERHELANGIRLLVAPLRRLPAVTALIMLDAGAECDAPSKAGAAALTAGALAEGTTQRPADELATAFEQLGGALEVDASWNVAECGTTILTSHFGDAFRLLGEVVQTPAFPSQEVERLRMERLAELLQNKTEPRGLADDMFSRFIFGRSSRYAIPEGGDENSVAQLGRDDVVTHFRRFFSPTRATVIVAGDVDVGEVLSITQESLGGWQAASGQDVRPDVAPAFHERGIHLVDKADAPQSELRVGHVSVSRRHKDYYAMAVMNAILGGLFNSRINMNLRERHAYTYGAFSTFGWTRHASSFEVSTAVQSDVSAAAVREILDETDRIRESRVTPEELSLAVDYLTGVFPIRFETTAAIADALAMREGFGLATDYYDTYRAHISAITVEDVRRVAEDHLQPGLLQVVAVGDAASIAPSLEALQWGVLRTYDVHGTPQ